MSPGGINYNADMTFSNSKTAEEYIDTAIAKNIRYSLKSYQYGGHFRRLSDLYERGELTNCKASGTFCSGKTMYTRKIAE